MTAIEEQTTGATVLLLLTIVLALTPAAHADPLKTSCFYQQTSPDNHLGFGFYADANPYTGTVGVGWDPEQTTGTSPPDLFFDDARSGLTVSVIDCINELVGCLVDDLTCVPLDP